MNARQSGATFKNESVFVRRWMPITRHVHTGSDICAITERNKSNYSEDFLTTEETDWWETQLEAFFFSTPLSSLSSTVHSTECIVYFSHFSSRIRSDAAYLYSSRKETSIFPPVSVWLEWNSKFNRRRREAEESSWCDEAVGLIFDTRMSTDYTRISIEVGVSSLRLTISRISQTHTHTHTEWCLRLRSRRSATLLSCVKGRSHRVDNRPENEAMHLDTQTFTANETEPTWCSFDARRTARIISSSTLRLYRTQSNKRRYDGIYSVEQNDRDTNGACVDRHSMSNCNICQITTV